MMEVGIFLFGLIIGSFLNALIYRLESIRSLVKARSECTHCHKVLRVRDLIPLVSFAWLRGRCFFCAKKISWQYPMVELATGTIFLLSFLEVGVTWTLIPLLLLMCCLVVIFVYDLHHHLILDRVSVPAIMFAALVGMGIGHTPQSQLIGVLIGGGFFLAQFLISRGTWVGGGDIRLGVVMGLALGGSGVLFALLVAYVLGALVGIGMLIFHKASLKSALPFGPFLVGATICAFFWGQDFIHWYLLLF